MRDEALTSYYRISIRCLGRVQGVYYRASTRSTAIKLGISGWVKNEVNGDVTIEAFGTEDQLNQLVQWCKDGPPLSRVDDVICNWDDFQQEDAPDTFEIHYK